MRQVGRPVAPCLGGFYVARDRIEPNHHGFAVQEKTAGWKADMSDEELLERLGIRSVNGS
jgi:hypothetical protein